MDYRERFTLVDHIVARNHAPFLRFYLHLRTVCALLRTSKSLVNAEVFSVCKVFLFLVYIISAFLSLFYRLLCCKKVRNYIIGNFRKLKLSVICSWTKSKVANGNFACGEYTHDLPLASELAELRSGYVHPIRAADFVFHRRAIGKVWNLALCKWRSVFKSATTQKNTEWKIHSVFFGAGNGWGAKQHLITVFCERSQKSKEQKERVNRTTRCDYATWLGNLQFPRAP